ncbi:MAG: helix-turn-helix domain-containing protein [Candidatus Acidiferrales bacterium]
MSRTFVSKPVTIKVDLEGIGGRIRSLRSEMLQEDLAMYLGISQGQLSKIERGKLGPTVEILIRLVKKFGKSADWILMGQD